MLELPETPQDPPVDEQPAEQDLPVDYAKVYDELLEQFNRAYHQSQTLYMTNKMQRQTLYHYKRRNNAMVDFLRSYDDGAYEALDDEPMPIDAARIESLIAFRPHLRAVLQPMLQIANDVPPSDIQLDESYGINLLVDELIPELPSDELDAAELNPQDLDMWTRRNFYHLVVSKFKPAEIRAKGVRDYATATTPNVKRRKRKDG